MNNITNEQLEIAKSNGIGRSTLISRLRYGWDIERAITVSPLNSNENVDVTEELTELRENGRSNSWYSFGDGQLIECPVPSCSHRAGVITKAHCRLEHGMERDDVKEAYGMPFKVGIDKKKRFGNLKEGFK